MQSRFRTDGTALYKSPSELVFYKKSSEVLQTAVESVSWSVSDTGNHCPILHITPLELCGVVVSTVSLGSLQNYQKKRVGAGAEITVKMAGMVIPVLVDVIKEAEPVYPTKCQKCGADLIAGVHLTCPHHKETFADILVSRLKLTGLTAGTRKSIRDRIESQNLYSQMTNLPRGVFDTEAVYKTYRSRISTWSPTDETLLMVLRLLKGRTFTVPNIREYILSLSNETGDLKKLYDFYKDFTNGK